MSFTFSTSSKTNELLNNMQSGVFFKRNILPKINLIEFGLIAKEAVEQELSASLGDRAKHFKVTLSGTNQYGIRITIVADNIGKMLFEGTPEHRIDANSKIALHFTWNGEEVFYEHVENPGIKPIADEIEKIVNHAVRKAAMIYE
jgi:hypothetical protein